MLERVIKLVIHLFLHQGLDLESRDEITVAFDSAQSISGYEFQLVLYCRIGGLDVRKVLFLSLRG